MDYKNKIIGEIETIPESLLPEVLNFIQSLKPKSTDSSQSTLASNSQLSNPWEKSNYLY